MPRFRAERPSAKAQKRHTRARSLRAAPGRYCSREHSPGAMEPGAPAPSSHVARQGSALRTPLASLRAAAGPSHLQKSAMSASRNKDERAKPDRPGSGTRARATVEGDASTEDAAELLRQLDEAALWLGRIPAGPLRRELKLTMERYRRAVQEWARCGPAPVRGPMLVQGVRVLRSAIARSVADLDPGDSSPTEE